MNKDTAFLKMRSVPIVLAGILSGFIATEIWNALLTDYGFWLSVAFTTGLYSLIPAAILFLVILYLRKKLTGEKDFTNFDYLFLSFLSGFSYYHGLRFLLGFGFPVLSSYPYIFLSAILLIPLISVVAAQLVHWSIRALLPIRISMILLGALVLCIAAFIAVQVNTKPSARDVCRKILVGDSESMLLDKLSKYVKRESMTFYPPEDYYTYGVGDNQYLLISPGLYCQVTVDGGVVTEMEAHADSL